MGWHGYGYGGGYGGWAPYVPVAERRRKAMKKMDALRKKGVDIQPVTIKGRKIASSFWGEAWCEHLESFSDFENRLPRGRTYVRNGSVCHLGIAKGQIEAKVSGSELYTSRSAQDLAGQEVDCDQGAVQRSNRLAPGTAPGQTFRPRHGGRLRPQGRAVSLARRNVVPLQLPGLGPDVQACRCRALWDRRAIG